MRNEECIEAIRAHIYADYRDKTLASLALYNEAKQYLPGGVSGNLRYFDPYPLYIEHGQGAIVTDVDGNNYIDSFSANGPMLLGHNHPSIKNAIESAKSYGSLPLNPPIMVECAKLITQIIPCAEQVRFLNTGTEAVMTSVRYARAYTGKNKILKFHGHYHGQDDQFLFGIDSSSSMFSDGVPGDAISNTLICTYNNFESISNALETDDDIAAVILDPAMHAGGLWGSSQKFLNDLRDITSQSGVLLIFDEVITGFRLALGGAQEYYGVTPDLVTMAKALGAGEKIALVGGKKEVMSVVDPNAALGTPRVFQSGTVNDGAIALAGTVAALKTYQELNEQGEYQTLFDKTVRLKEGIESAFEKHGIHCQVNCVASMLQILITPESVDFDSAQQLDMSLVVLFYHALINEGVLLSLPTSNHIYLSFAHSDENISQIIEKTELVLEQYNFESVFN